MAKRKLLKTVTKSGNRLEALENLALIVADAIDNYTEEKSLSQLIKQYRETMKEIEEIKGREDFDDEISEILSVRVSAGKSGAVRKNHT